MKKVLLLILGFSSLLFGACNNRIEGRLNDTKMVEIVSIPEGATIIVNGLNLGKAPLNVEFAMNEFACFIRPAVIRALAQEPSLYTQIKTYPRFSANTEQESKVPEKIIFDMTIAPAVQAK